MTRWREGEALYEIVARALGDTLEVVVDDQKYQPQVEADGTGGFVLCTGPSRQRFWCVRSGDAVHVFWQGSVHVLTREREGATRSASQADAGLQAPMPGKVIKLAVRAGDTVVKGAELLVVESMKMENALRAPRDGRVKSVACALGDMVVPGPALVELE